MKQFLIRFGCLSILFSTVVSLILHQLEYPITGIDDANIFFVYAKNLSQGHGFVYNIGGERVEGFTSLLWVLIATISFFFTDYPESLLLLFNIILLSATMTSLTLYLDHLFEWKKDNNLLHIPSPYSVLYLAILFSSPDYITWMTVTLMDIGIWGILLINSTLVVLRIHPGQPVKSLIYRLSALIMLSLLTRPESMIWSLVFIGMIWLRFYLVLDRIKANHIILLPLTTYGITLLLLTLFRLIYFGYPLPNTYYAKVSPSLVYNLSQGITYFREYFVSGFIVQLSMLCFLVLIYRSCVKVIQALLKKNVRVEGIHFLPIITLIGLLIPIITGGDHFSLFRFYQPIYSLLLLHIFIVGKSFMNTWVTREHPVRIHQIIVFAMLLLFIWESQRISWNRLQQFGYIKREFYVAEQWRTMGKFLSEFWNDRDDYPTIGSIVAGGIKRSYPGEIIDLMGLNNTKMAHSPGKRMGIKNHAAFEKKTFYEMHPDIILPYIIPNVGCIQNDRIISQKILTNTWVKVSLKNIWSDSEFQKKYDFAQITKKIGAQNRCLTGFMSKQFLTMIDNDAEYTVQIIPYY